MLNISCYLLFLNINVEYLGNSGYVLFLTVHKPIVEAKFHNPCGRKDAISRMGSANFGFSRMDSANFGINRMGSANFGFSRMDSANFGFSRMGSANFVKLCLFIVFKCKFESSDLAEWVLLISDLAEWVLLISDYSEWILNISDPFNFGINRMDSANFGFSRMGSANFVKLCLFIVFKCKC